MTLAEELIKCFHFVRYEQPENFFGVNLWEDDYKTNERAVDWYRWALYENNRGEVYFGLKFHPEEYTLICRITSTTHFAQVIDALGIEL